MLDYILNLAINGAVGYCSYKAGETRGKLVSDYEYMQREMLLMKEQLKQLQEENKNKE